MSQDTMVGSTPTPLDEYETAGSKLSQFRLTLSDLFVIVAFCAGLSLVYSRSWAVPWISILAISLSLVIGFFFVVSGLGKYNPAIMLTWLFPSGIVLGCAGSIALFWVAAIHCVGAIVLCFVPRRFRTPRILMRCSMVMIACGLVHWTNVTPYHLERLIMARNEHPMEDISTRLSFEHRNDESESVEESDQKLATNVEARLKASEVAIQASPNYGNRIVELKRIHSDEFERFVRRAGFGAIRMQPAGLRIETPELPTINLARAIVEEKDPDWSWILYDGRSPAATKLATASDFSELHFASENDFLNPNMFGFVAKAQPEEVHAAGFEPHAFHDGLAVEKTAELESLQLKKLELISLLKFDKPKAYVLDHLPRMDQLSEEDIATRDLTDFELNALDQLRSEENVVIEQNDGVILMMGALRAGTHCLDCHSGSRGKLLGAFSYEFSVGM